MKHEYSFFCSRPVTFWTPDRHGAAFKRIFLILFIASTLKITEKGHQYEDMCGVTSIKILDVDVEHRGDIILVQFDITFNSK